MKRGVWVIGLVVVVGGSGCGGDEEASGDTTLTATGTDVATDSTVTIPDQIVFDSDGGDVDAADTTGTTGTTGTTDTATGPTDTSDPGEVSTGCNTFGCSCQGNGDCLDGLCIESADGRMCTRTCISECPEDFDCVQSSSFGDPISLCVPRYTRLCRPCQADADCQSAADPFPAYCVLADDPANGSFCSASCASRPCPEGYACEDVTTQAGGTARQCVPESGECTCRPSWSGLGLVTDCQVKNAFGACDGTRTCGANGLTACTGPQASPELCDGADNDCNDTPDDIPAVACLVTNTYGSCPGTTACGGNETVCVGKEPAPETCNGIDDNCVGGADEGSCEDGLTCTTDTCQGGSQCTHALNAGSCLINGACWAMNTYNPLSACEVCDPARSTLTWSQAAGTCVIGGACYPNGAVNPQNACQVCNANQTSTAWTTQTNTCQIGGQCYLANDTNPTNPCEICVPTTSTVAWTQAFNTCNIQDQCYAAGAKKPGEPCYVCDPSRSASGWSTALNGTSCDDGNACSSTSACNGAGVCVGDTSCNDGIACTQDTCTQAGCDNTQVAAGYCRISNVCWNNQAQHPSNVCQWCDPTSSKTAWSNRASNVSCSDGFFCTSGDHCNGLGSCVGGGSGPCGDAYACTNDVCNEASDSCTYPLQTSKCLISGTCYTDGDAQSGFVCNECEPTASTSGWTFITNKGCNDGNECTTADKCTGGACAGTAIRDGLEVNDTSGTAYNLGNYNDGQGFPQRKEVNLTMYGSGDVDWFTYFVDDVVGGDLEPRVRVSNIPAGHNYELCIWFRCTNEDKVPANLDCAGAGGTNAAAITVGGKQYNGCCKNAAGNATEDIKFEADPVFDSEMECPSGDDDFRAYVRITNLTSNWTCSTPYTLEIGDD